MAGISSATRSNDCNDVAIRIATSRPQFEFISVSGTNIRGDAATRKRVRSRAQADYKRRQVPSPKPTLHQEFDVAEWLRAMSHENVIEKKNVYKNSSERRSRYPSSQRSAVSHAPFGTDRPDLFALMAPAELKRAQMLWAHLYKGTCVVFKSMVEIGFLDMLQGSAALIQMLSSSAWHMKNESGEMGMAKGDADYARYSVMATTSLRRMLQEPDQRATVETIIAILTFAAYANLTSDTKLLNVHLDGLSHILVSIGGLDALRPLPILRLMLYWIDVRAAHLQDISPRFLQPWDILSERSQLSMSPTTMHGLAKGLTLTLEDDLEINEVCSCLIQANTLIDSRFAKDGDKLWQSVLFAQFNLLPIMHLVLSMTRYDISDRIEHQRRKEYFRIAVILYIRELWARFGMDTTTGTSLYTEKLAAGVASLDLVYSWGADDAFRYWILLIGAACSSVPGQVRQKFGILLTSHMTAVELPPGLTSSLWCDSALGSLGANLHDIRSRGV